jgi:hypothetical protein
MIGVRVKTKVISARHKMLRILQNSLLTLAVSRLLRLAFT